MPDLESFIINAKNQEEIKSTIKRKNKKKGEEEHDVGDEDDFTDMIAQPKVQSGTRTRPEIEETKGREKVLTYSKDQKDIKITYPHKKHQVSLKSIGNL